MLQAKRVAPPEIAPVTVGKLRIEAVHWGKDRGLEQNGGYIAAFDPASGNELWILQIYKTEYDPEMEEDVQDVFIAKMSKGFLSKKLKIVDEKGRKYLVDTDEVSVTSL
ncbi:hypothetical protein [Motiliproteus sp. MSK22-1]|uniref:hypothetical protein n=1 Tax=Motiliproteus sp. MSK22-1 TaxID=1897630 RepID=UPI0009761B9F|nr:hypothetical protein [Motiliproteus sp. MSK22-1]OMH38321.1 hypothetical protein BGP75_08745 [Motiliproteus sp. MSK22-1]